MEFHDILHGHIIFKPESDLTHLLFDLINSPEINRLRNMRQMNFDVPLIQELGRSRRLPHTIGVTYISTKLGERHALTKQDSKNLLAAAMLHDAAIPPYGHLVESELKSRAADFRHEKRVQELILGNGNKENKYLEIVPHKHLQLPDLLSKHEVDKQAVINLICPSSPSKTPIAADIDIDNIDNIHRMAAMLGWAGAKENLHLIISNLSLNGMKELRFSKDAIPAIKNWLNYRQKIYTMVIAHPECIPYNALQTDLVRLALDEEIITPENWYLSEPEFEERLRNSNNKKTSMLASQLISGCEYQTVDYIWAKGFSSTKKLQNAEIVAHFNNVVPTREGFGYFVWNEKSLISRAVQIAGDKWGGDNLGFNSTSCLIALVKKTPGKGKWTKQDSSTWRRQSIREFTNIFETHQVDVDYPETYTGDFYGDGNRGIQIEFH